MATSHVQCRSMFSFAGVQERIFTYVIIIIKYEVLSTQIQNNAFQLKNTSTFATANDRLFVLAVAKRTIKQLLCSIRSCTSHHPQSRFM
jgi:hypothetical protein